MLRQLLRLLHLPCPRCGNMVAHDDNGFQKEA
jgi:ribosomal protein S27AE